MLTKGRIYHPLPPTGLNRDVHHPADLPFSVPPSLITPFQRCRNINRLSITYAFRLQLRNRLTLSRLPLPRNPKIYGDKVSHLVYRYSCLHKLFSNLQTSLRLPFVGNENAPLPIALASNPAASALCLSPVTFSAQINLTSELLRFL